MSFDMSVTKKSEHVFVVKVNGSIDVETHQELEVALIRLLDGKTKAVILDMEGVTYINSSGLRVVINAKKEYESKSTTFTIVNMQPQIKKVFDIMKILPLFDIFDDMPDADKYIDQVLKEEIEKQPK